MLLHMFILILNQVHGDELEGSGNAYNTLHTDDEDLAVEYSGSGMCFFFKRAQTRDSVQMLFSSFSFPIFRAFTVLVFETIIFDGVRSH